jgi:hypothetical protein
MVGSFGDYDFDSIVIDRSDVGCKRRLGDYLLRAAYHEAARFCAARSNDAYRGHV